MANTDLPFEQEVTDPVTTSIENARRRFNEEFFIKPSTSPVGMLNIPLNPPNPNIQQPFRFEPLMANQPSSVVGGMFSPEISRAAEMQYLQGRQKEMRDRALAFAQLSPMQQADYGFYRGGQQLGDVVGGALGGQDPQLKLISQRQQMLSMIDPDKPETFGRAIQYALQTGDRDTALMLNDEMKNAQARKTENLKLQLQRLAQNLYKADGSIDEQVYSTLQGYGAVGQAVIDQQFKGFQNLQTQKAQVLGRQLFNADGTPNPTIIAELRKTPEGRKILEENAPKTISVKGDETIMTVPVLGETPKVIQQGQKVEPFTGTMANAANFLYQTTDPKKIFATYGQAGLDAVDRKAEEMSTKEAIAKAPKIVVDLNDPTAVAKASLDVMGKWQDFLKSAGDVETASRFKALQSSVALAQGGNTSADGATIFNIGKIYDPSGAVQEGDKDTILGNRAIPAKIQALAQRVFQGGSLTPKERENLLEVGTQLIKGKEEELQKYRLQYIRKNKALGGLEEDILNPYDGLIKSSSQSSVSQIPTGKEVKPQVIKQPPVKQDQSSQQKGKVVKNWSDLK